MNYALWLAIAGAGIKVVSDVLSKDYASAITDAIILLGLFGIHVGNQSIHAKLDNNANP